MAVRAVVFLLVNLSNRMEVAGWAGYSLVRHDEARDHPNR